MEPDVGKGRVKMRRNFLELSDPSDLSNSGDQPWLWQKMVYFELCNVRSYDLILCMGTVMF